MWKANSPTVPCGMLQGIELNFSSEKQIRDIKNIIWNFHASQTITLFHSGCNKKVQAKK